MESARLTKTKIFSSKRVRNKRAAAYLIDFNNKKILYQNNKLFFHKANEKQNIFDHSKEFVKHQNMVLMYEELLLYDHMLHYLFGTPS
jgi:hydroxyacyl-ACP dehydratase HTD2-like protein with hotdog domain